MNIFNLFGNEIVSYLSILLGLVAAIFVGVAYLCCIKTIELIHKKFYSGD